ncbi:hypothetical protein E6C67_14385 [Azospirillum sp. TSA2s]|uniref:hypothetical protein n=1 Tax=Azospirillum sp. TSA2s TaxID=709810 RepID=UPI0010A9A9B9|nr:hypothetical protein [Azospirillum sp. TSA2s]QCG95014.1 hypothetical protein E6C67_14385 [Azospirillum sp. TSA2s]
MATWNDIEEGRECPSQGCPGTLELAYPDDGGCSCHIAPPCGHCTSSFLRCTECDWTSEDDLPVAEPETELDRFRRVFKDRGVMF